MATYHKDIREDDDARCDGCSRFSADGFPLPMDDGKRREWSPLWGGPCVACGTPC